MNIDTKTNLNIGVKNDTYQSQTTKKNENSDFSSELKEIQNTNMEESEKEIKETKSEEKNNENEKITNENNIQAEKENIEINKVLKVDLKEENVNGAIDGLKDIVQEINKLNRSEEIFDKSLKQKFFDDDNNRKEELDLIDNNINIQEPKDKLNLQMGNMNFNENEEQPFAEFVNPQESKAELNASIKDLEEENAILSTMEENVAIANKNMALSKTKTVSDEKGIKKVDKNTNVTVETIVNYDTVIMDKSDVEFFTKLVNEGVVDLKEVQNSSKSSAVSKTLADLLAKAMNDNRPIRINFDNDISVIIKISRDGKISADFLPSSQVAEAYLKENLPLLKQRFDDNNIDYDELNQRKQKQDNNEDRKKGRKDE